MVAIIEPVGGHGGMDYYDFGLAHGLSEAGEQVTIYTCDKTKPKENASFKCDLVFKGIYGDGSKVLRAYRYLKGLFASLKASRASNDRVVHFHFFHTGLMEYVSLVLAKLYGRKIVVTVHDVESFSSGGGGRMASLVFGMADKLIVHNEVSQNELLRYSGVEHPRVAKIRHGNYIPFINNQISRGRAREYLGLDKDEDVVLFFGQIKSVKGLDVLIEAMAKVVQRRPTAKLLIAGKVWKDDFQTYGALIDKLNLSGNVIKNIRYIPDEEAAYYYSAADVVALPYRKIYQSGVLLMAMSYERAVVASDLPGMVEVITDGKNGVVFPQGDALALADKIAKVLEDTSLRDRLASEGAALMRESYDWTRIGRFTSEVYHSLRSA